MEEKKLGINLIKNMKLANMLAIILISIALVLETVEFAFDCTTGAFLFQNLFAYIFEVVTNELLIYALIRKHPPLIEIALVVLKVFEGTYYPIKSCERLDSLLLAQDGSTLDIVSHILFAISAFSLLFGLIFYCIYKLSDKIKYWDIMKFWVLIASFFMFGITILYIVDFALHGEISWEELLEPIALTILFLGMFMTYEYVEEEIIYNE